MKFHTLPPTDITSLHDAADATAALLISAGASPKSQVIRALGWVIDQCSILETADYDAGETQPMTPEELR